jgi:hypothetical protein
MVQRVHFILCYSAGVTLLLCLLVCCALHTPFCRAADVLPQVFIIFFIRFFVNRWVKCPTKDKAVSTAAKTK